MQFTNLSDGKTDGLALFYIKDGTIYPIGLTKDQATMLDISVAVLGTIAVSFKNPIGKAVSLLDEGARR